jgi:hypothetical protein
MNEWPLCLVRCLCVDFVGCHSVRLVVSAPAGATDPQDVGLVVSAAADTTKPHNDTPRI